MRQQRHWKSWNKGLCGFYFFFVFLSFKPVYAANVRLTISHQSIDEHVTVNLKNNSIEKALIESVYIELDHKKYEHLFPSIIPPLKTKTFHFNVEFPALPGSYPLTVVVRYFNKEQILSFKHVGLFYFQEPATLDITCIVEDATIDDRGDIIIKSNQPEIWKLILPDKVNVSSSQIFPDHRVYHVINQLTGFSNNYSIFAVAEKVVENKHFAGICSGTLRTGYNVKRQGAATNNRGKVPSIALLILSIIFLSITYYIILKLKTETRLSTALGKYSCRIFLVTFLYYFLKNVDLWLESVHGFAEWKPFQDFIIIVINNFRGTNFDYFFQYFVDIYLAACFILMFPYFYYLDRSPLKHDKYASFMRTVFSLKNIFRKKKIYWNNLSKLGFLTIGVKLFYIPYLTSWAINNTIHQKNLTSVFQWDFHAINAYLLAMFIYVDTIIYAFGYLVESRYLKNEIKSVEPTILGWVVTLWCYPPFNVFSFRIFDYQIVDISNQYPGWVDVMMTCVITFLWGIFAWATVALGFKASNLTNRGIIECGPYRFVRHPAYAAKLSIWLIQTIFFAQYWIGLFMGYVFIYALRAWTEERHLSKDSEYLKYKKKVSWKFIPGLI